MKSLGIHPGQLEIDFTVPAKESLSVAEISRIMKISTSKIYAAIDRGELLATSIHTDGADREEWRVPLHNYLAWVGNEFPERLLYTWPGAQWLTPDRLRRFLGCSVQTIHNHIRQGEFPHAENIGAGRQKCWRIPLFDLVAFVQRRSNAFIC